MHRSLLLTPSPIDEVGLIRSRPASTTSGAVLVFNGIVRGEESGARIAGLDYEAFERMAVHQFERLFDELETRWPRVESLRLVHRTGPVAAGEASLWLEIRSPHRAEAFAAGQWLIDEMKRVVPIWKRPMSHPGD
jgi:molybdopterin synthase catalytic subunit